MPRSGGGDPSQRRSTSTRSPICSPPTHSVAQEHDELPMPSKHFKAKQQKRTAEDDILIQMVNLHGPKNWSTIACPMPGRSPNQCRERWMFYLDPALNKQPWSELEEMALIQAHQIHGNKWCKLAKLLPGSGRTGKAVKNHWLGPMKKKMKSYLARGLSEQLPYRPNDPLIQENRGSSARESGQASSKNIQVSSDLPVRPKSEQGLTEAGGNEFIKGSDANFVNKIQKLENQIALSDLLVMTEEKLASSSGSVDQKVPFESANFPRSLENEELTNFLEVQQGIVNTSSNDYSDEICPSADPESAELHLSNIADLLDMSYCGSLMIIPPDSPNEENSVQGM
ncbi:hypothetical protein ACP4OV_010078 [Aristida adscensionis]